MPYLELGNDMAFNMAEILGVMYFPGDDCLRDQFKGVFLSKIYIEEFEIRDCHNKEELFDDLLSIAKRLIHAPSFEEICNKMKIIYPMGCAAGDMLFYIYQMSKDGINKPSIKKAKKIVSDKYGDCYTYSGDIITFNDGMGNDTISKVWAQYSPVAHLWAAYRDLVGGSKESIDTFNIEEHLFSELKLPVYLSAAEKYRRFGETTKSPIINPPRYILNSEDTWKVANTHNLPPLDFQVPPLDEWSADILKRKRRRNMLRNPKQV